MISTSRTSDFQISGSAISSHKNIQDDVVHNVIFLFHMPLFIILSGMMLSKTKLVNIHYLKHRAASLLFPYFSYIIIDSILFRNDFSFKLLTRMLWGGRAFSGVYWYITCLIASMFMFGFFLKHFSERTIKHIVIIGGGIAVLESHLSEKIPMLVFPGIPWNMDVALIAIVYLALGFYYKESIRRLLEDSSFKFDVTAIVVSLAIIVFCIFNYWGGRRIYYFNLKPLYYKELFLAIIIPCAFGLVLCRLVYWIDKIECGRVFKLSILTAKTMNNGQR